MTDIDRYWPTTLASHPDLRDRLKAAYDEPHRRYHNTTHLQEVFERIGAIMGSPVDGSRHGGDVDRDAVLLAAWFHDAVYDGDRDDEERSAELARRELTAAAVPAAVVAEVVRLVRLTETHQVSAGDTNGQVLCDADLGILAADAARYAQYTQDVRREYEHLDDHDFRRGRTQVLQKLLEAPALFHSGFAKQHWESSARENVQRELAQLEGS